MGYAQARKDFEYLETIKELDDHVEIDAQVYPLLQNPTRKTAEQIYRSAISLWFSERWHEGWHSENRRVWKIADRYLERTHKRKVITK